MWHVQHHADAQIKAPLLHSPTFSKNKISKVLSYHMSMGNCFVPSAKGAFNTIDTLDAQEKQNDLNGCAQARNLGHGYGALLRCMLCPSSGSIRIPRIYAQETAVNARTHD